MLITKHIEAVKRQIDSDKPALVWHAFTNCEYDVVCSYDDKANQFIGKGHLCRTWRLREGIVGQGGNL